MMLLSIGVFIFIMVVEYLTIQSKIANMEKGLFIIFCIGFIVLIMLNQFGMIQRNFSYIGFW